MKLRHCIVCLNTFWQMPNIPRPQENQTRWSLNSRPKLEYCSKMMSILQKISHQQQHNFMFDVVKNHIRLSSSKICMKSTNSKLFLDLKSLHQVLLPLLFFSSIWGCKVRFNQCGPFIVSPCPSPLDFCCLCSLQRSSSKMDKKSSLKIEFVNQRFQKSSA